MKFGPLQVIYFRAEDGAYSVVTGRERLDPQITVDQYEREIVLSVFSRSSILTGPKKDDLGADNPAIYKKFRLWPDGKVIDVQINFPKPDKPNELRIYIPDTDPFSPPAGDIWFVFRRQGELHIGHMPENQWRSIGRIDDEDGDYAESIYAPEASPTNPHRVNALRYPRDPNKALTALKRAGYKCEVEPGIHLFTARRTKLPYLEPHHLIQVSLQKQFRKPLDHPDNIYALSPHHHRRIHYGTLADGIDVIDRLLYRRDAVLKRLGVTKDDLLGFYNLLNIQ